MQPDKEVVKLSKQLLGLKVIVHLTLVHEGRRRWRIKERREEISEASLRLTNSVSCCSRREILDLLEDKSSLSLAKLKVNQSMSKKKYKEEESKKKIGKRKMLEKKEEPIIKKKEKRHEWLWINTQLTHHHVIACFHWLLLLYCRFRS